MKGVAALLLIATGTNAIKVQSDPMFSSLGYETRHYKGEGDYDDYNVPNFGRDNEVVTTLKNAVCSTVTPCASAAFGSALPASSRATTCR